MVTPTPPVPSRLTSPPQPEAEPEVQPPSLLELAVVGDAEVLDPPAVALRRPPTRGRQGLRAALEGFAPAKGAESAFNPATAVRDGRGRSPLDLCALRNHGEACAALLAGKADPDAASGCRPGRPPPAMLACAHAARAQGPEVRCGAGRARRGRR